MAKKKVVPQEPDSVEALEKIIKDSLGKLFGKGEDGEEGALDAVDRISTFIEDNLPERDDLDEEEEDDLDDDDEGLDEDPDSDDDSDDFDDDD